MSVSSYTSMIAIIAVSLATTALYAEPCQSRADDLQSRSHSITTLAGLGPLECEWYAWRSDNEMVYVDRSLGFVRRDVATGTQIKDDILSNAIPQTLATNIPSAVGGMPAGIDWIDSTPDGRLVMWGTSDHAVWICGISNGVRRIETNKSCIGRLSMDGRCWAAARRRGRTGTDLELTWFASTKHVVVHLPNSIVFEPSNTAIAEPQRVHGGWRVAVWYPDSQIHYAVVTFPDTGERPSVVDGAFRCPGELRGTSIITPSPDGTEVILHVGFAQGNKVSTDSLYMCRQDGGNLRLLGTSASVDSAKHRLRGIEWLPSGRAVSYIYDDELWTLAIAPAV